MAINGPILDVGPTSTRVDAATTCVTITETVPPADVVSLQYTTTSAGEDKVAVVTISQAPQREGQVLAYKDGLFIELYIVVDISGVLTWKRASLTTGRNSSLTGSSWSSV